MEREAGPVSVTPERLARKGGAETEHVIHNQDGSIAERNSYGSDPADRPG